MSLKDVQFTCNLMNQRHGWNKYSVCVEHERMYLPEIGCHSCLLDDFQSSKIAPMSKARDRQVGGDHYGPENKVQAIDLCLDQNIPFCEGSAIKYLVRWRKKGGLQDLHKAQHYIQMLIDHEEANEAIPGDTDGSASPGD